KGRVPRGRSVASAVTLIEKASEGFSLSGFELLDCQFERFVERDGNVPEARIFRERKARGIEGIFEERLLAFADPRTQVAQQPPVLQANHGESRIDAALLGGREIEESAETFLSLGLPLLFGHVLLVRAFEEFEELLSLRGREDRVKLVHGL